MNKLIYTGILALAAVTLGSCSEENRGLIGDAKGSIALSVGIDTEITTGNAGTATTVSRASALAIDPEDLTLRVTSRDGSYSESWKYSEFPKDQVFNIGEYTVEAYYGDENEEGFEKPYYHGETTIKVMEDEVTPVSLTATLNNSMVEVTYTDNFKNYFSNYSATVTGSNSTVYVSPTESRPVYVKSSSTSVTITMTNPQGVETKLKSSPFVAKKRYLHSVVFDTDKNVGKPVVTITYDDSLNMEDEIISLDDLETAPEPTIYTEGFTSGVPVNIVEAGAAASPLKMILEGQGGITSAVLTTNSQALSKLGWPSKAELINADAETQAVLTALGLDVRGLFVKPDKMAVVDFTKVCKNISYIEGGQNETTFTITVTDRFDRQSEPVTLTINPEKSILEIVDNEPLFYNDPNLTLTVNYNGTDLENDVKFSYQNDRGTYTQINNVTATKISDSSYSVKLTVPANENSLTLRAQWDNKTVQTVIPRYGIKVDTRNVFAKSAEVTIDFIAPKTRAEAITFYAANGSVANQLTYQATANGYKLLNLTPNTAYSIYATVGDVRYSNISFKTEAEQTIPTGELNNWVEAGKGGVLGSTNWINWQIGDGTIWGTNNPMTTSEGDNYAKNRLPGTYQTNEGHNDESAVVLKTVGWGSSNQALSSMSTMKHADPGMLHLGASRTQRPADYQDVAGPLTTTDLKCGYPFSSRPAKLTFWCKYKEKNSADRGYAYVAVKDATGKVISENTIAIEPTGEYVQKELPLTYGFNSPAAASIYVLFMSTNTESALQKDSSWITPATFAGVNSTYRGSELYIDDIELTY